MLISYRYFHDEVLLPITPGMKPLTQEKLSVFQTCFIPGAVASQYEQRSIFVSTNARAVSGMDDEEGRELVGNCVTTSPVPAPFTGMSGRWETWLSGTIAAPCTRRRSMISTMSRA